MRRYIKPPLLEGYASSPGWAGGVELKAMWGNTNWNKLEKLYRIFLQIFQKQVWRTWSCRTPAFSSWMDLWCFIFNVVSLGGSTQTNHGDPLEEVVWTNQSRTQVLLPVPCPTPDTSTWSDLLCLVRSSYSLLFLCFSPPIRSLLYCLVLFLVVWLVHFVVVLFWSCWF